MIRYAMKEDIPAIESLGTLLFPNFTELFHIQNILDETFSKVFVAEENGVVVGFLHVTELYENMDIVNIVVDPSHRKQGIASLLLDYAFDDASSSVQIATLEVDVENVAAIALYQKFRFAVMHTRKNYYQGERDAYLMGKKMNE